MRHDFRDVLAEGRVRDTSAKDVRRKTRRKSKVNLALGEDLPPKEGLSVPYRELGHRDRSWPCRTRVITRFLKSAIGRPWDEVHSELSKQLKGGDPTSKLARKVMKSWWSGVHTNTFLDDEGYVWANTSGGSDPVGPGDFYVDPTTRLLCFAKGSKKWKPPAANKDPNIVKDKHMSWIFYVRITGVWYQIVCRNPTDMERGQGNWLADNAKLSYLSSGGSYISSTQILRSNLILNQIADSIGQRLSSYMWSDTRCVFGDYLLPISKRQLSSREIKAQGLAKGD